MTTTFDKPRDVTAAEAAYGPRELHLYLPSRKEIPDEFRSQYNEWNELVSEWFFSGLKVKKIKVKDGIDANKAIAHCATIMRSFEPKHEHKVSGVAFLLSKWFTWSEEVEDLGHAAG